MINKKVHSNIILECIYFLKQKFLLSDDLLKMILSAQSQKIISHTYEDWVIQLEPIVLWESLVFFQWKMIKWVFVWARKLPSGDFWYYLWNGVYNRFWEKINQKK
jgi:hypothetical protein